MKSLGMVFLTIISLLFVGCGSDSGSSATGGSTAYTARFIDSPVENLAFVNQSGTTTYSDSTGSFNCTQGELLSVKLGNLELGRVSCGEKVYPHAITDDTDITASAPGTYLSAVLQRLDEDNDPSNGIKIPAAAHAVTDFPDPEFYKTTFNATTEFADMNSIITKVYTDNSRDWTNIGDMDAYITSDVVPHLQTSAGDYLADIRSSIIGDTFTGSYSRAGSSITNDAGSPCAYDNAFATISCGVNVCQLTLTLEEGGTDDVFTYMFTQYPVVNFANTFDDSNPYRVMVDLELKNDGQLKIVGTYKDDYTVSAPVCGGTFELVHD